MAWEGERGGFYFRLSLFDIEKLIKSGGVVRAKRSIVVGQVCFFFKSLVDHLPQAKTVTSIKPPHYLFAFGLDRYGKSRAMTYRDQSLNYLGYSTDNGTYITHYIIYYIIYYIDYHIGNGT